MQPRQSRTSITVAILLVLCVWALAFAAIFGRNVMFDWWRLHGYTPPAEIAQLATDTTMTEDSRQLFYVYHPSIEASDTFNAHCRDSEYTIVLGCYISYEGIYIFNIDDERLQGVQQVTAAHEMLHAAYDRLSGDEKKRIDALLAETYQNIQSTRLKDTVAQYEKNDPASVPNELHSILATEVRDLPAELETYYARYFTDRSKVVSYSEQYETAFSGRKSQIERLEKELTDLKAKIDDANRDLETRQEYLHSTSVRSRAQNGTASQQEIDSYNDDVNEFNANIASTNRLVSSYNSKREQYLQLVGEQNDLFKEIDSRQSISTE